MTQVVARKFATMRMLSCKIPGRYALETRTLPGRGLSVPFARQGVRQWLESAVKAKHRKRNAAGVPSR